MKWSSVEYFNTEYGPFLLLHVFCILDSVLQHLQQHFFFLFWSQEQQHLK